MKTKIYIMIVFVLSLISIIVVSRNYVDTSFATAVSLKYHYNNKEIDMVITDKNDIRIIKENLKGLSYQDNPSCGFSTDISIKLIDGERILVL